MFRVLFILFALMSCLAALTGCGDARPFSKDSNKSDKGHQTPYVTVLFDAEGINIGYKRHTFKDEVSCGYIEDTAEKPLSIIAPRGHGKSKEKSFVFRLTQYLGKGDFFSETADQKQRIELEYADSEKSSYSYEDVDVNQASLDSANSPSQCYGKIENHEGTLTGTVNCLNLQPDLDNPKNKKRTANLVANFHCDAI